MNNIDMNNLQLVRHRWSELEERFLMDNYHIYGPTYCANRLKLRVTQILSKTHKLELSLPKHLKNKLQSKSAEDCNVNPDQFNEIMTKEVAYFLGFMWADGYLNPSKNGSNHSIVIKILKDDMCKLKPIFDRLGKWNYYVREYKNSSWRDSETMMTNNKRIFNLLIEYDYGKKSQVSPDKILSAIPESLSHYFFLGLSDGDGCFYYYKPKKGSTQRQFSIASSYEQDWSYMIKLCEDMGIKYKIKLSSGVNPKTGNVNSSSQFRVTNKVGIQKLGEYLYKSFDVDGIGLPRKYNKYQLIVGD